MSQTLRQDGPAQAAETRARRVVLADADAAFTSRCAAWLSSLDFEPIVARDGVEAILAIQRKLPRVVVLDAALPRMYGFEICEFLRNNPELSKVSTILVGAIHRSDRYRRSPRELYGADAYVEKASLPEGLAPVLRNLGITLSLPPSVTPAAPPAVTVVPPKKEPVPVQPPAEDAGARRLARVIISDLVHVHADAFAAAVRAGNVVEAMRDRLADGRTIFSKRVAPELRNSRDFLTEELLRAAESHATTRGRSGGET